MKGQAGGALRIAAIQLLAGLVWLLPVTVRPLGIPFWRGGEYSDLLISHWPNAWYIRHSLQTWGQLPLWNPMILGGAPFAADPLSGLWYPPGWLAVLFPSGFAFNLSLWLHLAWAGTGMWLMLQRLQLAQPAALVGSLAFSGMPKLVGHIGLGHVGLVYAVSWTPWVALAAMAAAEQTASLGAALRRSAVAGGMLGLVFLADPRWAVPLSMIALAVAVGQIAHSHQETTMWPRWLAGRGALALACSLGMAAILALPLWEFVALSTRSELTRTESGALGLPAARLLGLIAPDLGGWPEWQAYTGAIVMVLALVALFGRSRGALFWAAVALSCWLLALGDRTPLHAILTRVVPGYSWLRVPSRWLFGSGFALAVLAAHGLHRLIGTPFEGRERSRFNLAVFGLLGLLLVLSFVSWRFSPDSPVGVGLQRGPAFAVSAAVLGTALIWTHSKVRRAVPIRWQAFGWVALLALDLALVDLSELESRPSAPAENATVAEVAAKLAPSAPERAYSPSYSLPQPAAAIAGLELVDGINPLQLRGLRDYMAAASGFGTEEYSVTQPPFPEGDPRRPWGVRPDPVLLGRLNVGYLVSAYSVEAEGWGFSGVAGGEYLYRNALARPRAWVELEAADGSWRPVSKLTWTPNRILIEAEGPGRLVISEMSYPGWQVRLNGAEHELQQSAHPLRSISLPAGTQQVELFFRPWTVFGGAAITLVTLAVLSAMWLIRE